MTPVNPPFPHLVQLAGQDETLVCGPDGCAAPEPSPVENIADVD